MADESDVEAALVTLVAGGLYPNGTGQASAVGAPVRIVRGWPTPDQLKGDLAAGKANVTIFSRNGVERNTTRFPREWLPTANPVHTVTATVAGNTVAIGGSISTPQNVMVLVGPRGVAFSYAVQPGDTPTSIATGLALLISASYPGTTSSGPVVTVANPAGDLVARVTGVANVVQEIKRQDKSFQISLWCPNPGLRDAIAKIVDPLLSTLSFISFPDGTCGWIRYERTITLDTAEAEGSYRRDLFYWVEYPTVIAGTAPEIGAVSSSILGGIAQPGSATLNIGT